MGVGVFVITSAIVVPLDSVPEDLKSLALTGLASVGDGFELVPCLGLTGIACPGPIVQYDISVCMMTTVFVDLCVVECVSVAVVELLMVSELTINRWLAMVLECV